MVSCIFHLTLISTNCLALPNHQVLEALVLSCGKLQQNSGGQGEKLRKGKDEYLCCFEHHAWSGYSDPLHRYEEEA